MVIWGTECHEQVSASIGSVLAYAELSQVDEKVVMTYVYNGETSFDMRLLHCFRWRDSVQGHTFWRKVYDGRYPYDNWGE